MHVLLIENQKCKDEREVTEAEVKKHISKLKNYKAQDIFGIAAEHLKFASPVLTLYKCYDPNHK